jgi:capsid protein
MAISDLLERIGPIWFDCAVLKGALKIAPRDMDRCSEQAWQARGWDWVDPLKDAKAASESIANRTKSRSEYIRANGDDPEQIFDEIEAEEALLRKKGLLPDPSTNTENTNDRKHEPVEDDE